MKYILMGIYICAALSALGGYVLWIYNDIHTKPIHVVLFIAGFALAAAFVFVYSLWKGFEVIFDLD